MHIGSPYGSSTRKQLVRPFLSSPITLLAYLLLVLCGVGLLEWVIRASAQTQVRHNLEVRTIWYDEYYSRVKLMPKHTVLDSRPRTRAAGLLRRQSGEPEPPPATTTTTITTTDPPSSTTSTTTDEPSSSTTTNEPSSSTTATSDPPSSTTTTNEASTSTSTTSINEPSSSTTTTNEPSSPTTISDGPPSSTTTTFTPPPTTTAPPITTTITTTTVITSTSPPPSSLTTTTPSSSSSTSITSTLSSSTAQLPPTSTTTFPSSSLTTTQLSTSSPTSSSTAIVDPPSSSSPSTANSPPTTSATTSLPSSPTTTSLTITTTSPVSPTTVISSTLTSTPSTSSSVLVTISSLTTKTTPFTSSVTATQSQASTTSTAQNGGTVVTTSTPITTTTGTATNSLIPQPTTSTTPITFTITSTDKSAGSSTISTLSTPEVTISSTSVTSGTTTTLVEGSISLESSTFTSILIGTSVISSLSSVTLASSTLPASSIILASLTSSSVSTSITQSVTTQSEAFTTSEALSSVTSLADKVSTVSSITSTTQSVLASTISGADNSVATPTAVAVSSCQRGLLCLFANKHEAVPLKDGYRTLSVPVNQLAEFAATYCPIILVIFFQSFWLIIYASIKLNEPFHQLAQSGGTPLKTGLLFEFLATGFPVDHFKKGFGGNLTSWYMIISYTILLILEIAPAFVAEAFSIQNVQGQCIKGSSTNDCVQRVWTVAVGPIRALQVALILVAILVLMVLVVRTYRGSALSLKKVNLALIATTLSDTRTVDILHNVNPNTTPEKASPFLQNQIWALEPSVATEIGTERASYVLRSTSERTQINQQLNTEPAESIPKRRGPPQPLINLLLPAVIILFLFILVSMYAANQIDDSKLRYFFGFVSFGPKFFLVGMCTILHVALGRVEHEVRVLTPYRSLHRSSDPRPALLRRLHPSGLTQTFAAFKYGEWSCAFISFMASYGVHILAVTISNVPYHPGRSVTGTIACIFVSLFLLISMAVALIAVVFWRRGNSNLGIQRLPEVLAEIYILMVHGRIPGVRMFEEPNENVTEFFGDAHQKKPAVVQRTIELEQ